MSSETARLVSSARDVVDAGTLIRRSLAQGETADPRAFERLESAAVAWLDEDVNAQRFEAGGAASATAADEADLLALVETDLRVATTLVAAGRVTGEIPDAGEGDPAEALDASVTALAHTADEVAEQGRASPPAQARFEGTAPDDPLACADRLRQLAADALEGIASRSSSVAGRAVSAITELAPDQFTKALEALGQRLRLGELAGRLLRLAARAFDRALAMLSRLVEASPLDWLRRQVAELRERLQAGEPGPAVVGWLVGVEAARDDVQETLQQGLPSTRLGPAADELEALSGRHQVLMNRLSGVIAGVGAAAALLQIFNVALPHAALFVAGAFVLALAAVVAIGVAYTDSGRLLSPVSGVRDVVRTAVA